MHVQQNPRQIIARQPHFAELLKTIEDKGGINFA